MKKRVKIIIIMAAFAVTAAFTVYAAYDSQSDPLISLSYLTNVFKPQIDSSIQSANNNISSLQNGQAAISGEVSSVESDVDAAESDISAIRNDVDNLKSLTPGEAEAYGYNTVKVTGKGTVVTAVSACDFIIRSGACTAVVPTGANMVNMTQYAALANGDVVRPDNLITVGSANSSCGLCLTSDTAYIMIRGEYKIAE